MCNGDVIGMSALKSDKNACDALAVKFIGLLLSSLIIVKIGWFKPGIRFRNLSWLKVVSCQVTDHCSRFVSITNDMCQWHEETNCVISATKTSRYFGNTDLSE